MTESDAATPTHPLLAPMDELTTAEWALLLCLPIAAFLVLGALWRRCLETRNDACEERNERDELWNEERQRLTSELNESKVEVEKLTLVVNILREEIAERRTLSSSSSAAAISSHSRRR